ncbi:hypothetical protein BGZ92_004845 [Podila epicladia]|nr:hypothetical protein BGZ92_004845 [Podila epicladia]
MGHTNITHFAHYVSFDLTASAKMITPPIPIPMPANDASYQSPGSFILNVSIPFQSTPQQVANSSSDPSKNKPVHGGVNTITGFLDQSALYG